MAEPFRMYDQRREFLAANGFVVRQIICDRDSREVVQVRYAYNPDEAEELLASVSDQQSEEARERR